METMIPPQVGMRLQTKKREIENERKREKGKCYYPFTTLLLQSSTMIFMIESPMLSLSYTSGNFSLQNLACIFQQWVPQMPQVFMTKQVGCTPTQFSFFSFHKLIALVHPLHGNPYSLTLIYIDGHLHSPLISHVDVRLSPFLSSPHNLHHHILFHLQCYIHGSRSCIA